MVKLLQKSLREYRGVSILTPILVSLEVVMECIIPFITARLVNEIKAGCSIDEILRIGGLLVLMAALSLLFGSLAGLTCSTASCGLGKNLRHDIFHAVQGYSFENIDHFLTSSLVTRMTTDVTNVQFAYMMVIRTAIRSPLMLVFAFIMAFVMGGRMAWIFLFVLPVLGLGLALVIAKTIPLFRRVFKKYDKLNESIQENVKAMRVVKSFVREDYESEKFGRAAEDVCADFTRAERILALNGPLMQFCIYSVMVFTLSFGSYTIISSMGLDLDVGQLSAMLTYGIQVLMSLMMVSMVLMLLTRAIACGKRIVEVLDEEPRITDKDADAALTVEDGSVRFDHVYFKYHDTAEAWNLEDVSFTVPSGATVGILGGTGSAKTTLVSMIPRLYDVDSGGVYVGGHNVKEYTMEALRKGCAMVLQKNTLFSGTIRENLRWGDENATDAEIEDACRLACADEFIEKMPDGYDTYIEQGGTNVSGGQKQRLCIARAVLRKPKILILDDSTSAVDTATDAKIRSALKTALPGTTKLIIAQRVTSVMDADLILVMDDGRVTAMGTHEELMEKSDIYREVYRSQQEGVSIDG